MYALPAKLFFTTSAVASGVLCIILAIQFSLEKTFGFYSLIPDALREERTKYWMLLVFVVEIVLYAIGPTAFYFWIYDVLPFFSYRAGISVAILLYLFGTLPFAVGLALRMKLPAGILAFSFFFNFVKLATCWGTVTYMMNT